MEEKEESCTFARNTKAMAVRLENRVVAGCLFSGNNLGGGYKKCYLNNNQTDIDFDERMECSVCGFVVPCAQVLSGACESTFPETNVLYIIHTQMKELKMLSAKGLYEAPCCEILSVKADGVLCQSFGEAGAAGTSVHTDSYDEDF